MNSFNLLYGHLFQRPVHQDGGTNSASGSGCLTLVQTKSTSILFIDPEKLYMGVKQRLVCVVVGGGSPFITRGEQLQGGNTFLRNSNPLTLRDVIDNHSLDLGQRGGNFPHPYVAPSQKK